MMTVSKHMVHLPSFVRLFFSFFKIDLKGKLLFNDEEVKTWKKKKTERGKMISCLTRKFAEIFKKTKIGKKIREWRDKHVEK